MSAHTLSVLVQNVPGVLARVSGLVSRRGFNIESLAVGPTESPEISKNRTADVPIVGDSKEVIGELVSLLRSDDHPLPEIGA
ncbi:MAG: acetolactate synthase small subunit, partial [Propionibacteriaceae bacterium]